MDLICSVSATHTHCLCSAVIFNSTTILTCCWCGQGKEVCHSIGTTHGQYHPSNTQPISTTGYKYP